MTERRIRSIPPRTTLDVFREQEGRRRKTRLDDSVNGKLSLCKPGQNSEEQPPEGFSIKDHVFQKPTGKRPGKDLVYLDEKIMWDIEIVEDDGLWIIAQLSGIDSSGALHFERSRRDYGQDNVVFFAPVRYKKKPAFLIFSTYGDIFETQVVPQKKDVSPFFREEIYWPKLLTHYVPASMRPSYNNGIYTVKYNERDIVQFIF